MRLGRKGWFGVAITGVVAIVLFLAYGSRFGLDKFLGSISSSLPGADKKTA